MKKFKKAFETLKLYNNKFIFKIFNYFYKYINENLYYINFKYNNFFRIRFIKII